MRTLHTIYSFNKFFFLTSSLGKINSKLARNRQIIGSPFSIHNTVMPTTRTYGWIHGVEDPGP